jgi:hypothetical protein
MWVEHHIIYVRISTPDMLRFKHMTKTKLQGTQNWDRISQEGSKTKSSQNTRKLGNKRKYKKCGKTKKYKFIYV